MADQSNWELRSADDVAQALDWLRRRMKGKGLVLIAVGVNSVAFALDTQVTPADAVELIQSQAETLRRGFTQAKKNNVTRGFVKRED